MLLLLLHPQDRLKGTWSTGGVEMRERKECEYAWERKQDPVSGSLGKRAVKENEKERKGNGFPVLDHGRTVHGDLC